MKMNKLLLIPVLAIASNFYAQTASAAPMKINCPLSSAKVEMVTNLPSGWWRTPYVNRLQGTAISNVGGKKTLICKYGNHAAFWTMKLVPAGKVCRTTNTGFVCKGPTQNRPQTFKAGPMTIPQTYLADLDYGVVRPKGADIWFQAKTATQRFITPRNGALLGIAGSRSVNLAGCKRLPLSNRSISLSALPVGTYVCAKTDQGRYSQFRINGRVGPSPGKLQIGYTTWKR